MDLDARGMIFVYLYEVFVHELTSILGPGKFVPFSLIAKCFAIAAKFSEEHANVLTFTYHQKISGDFGLDTADLVYINFLYEMEPIILPQDRSQDSTAATSHFGYRITRTGVILPTWSEAQRIEFLRGYCKYVPLESRDDISAIAYDLRMYFRGCKPGDDRVIVFRALPGIPKFSRQQDENALQHAMQHLQLDISQRKERESDVIKEILYKTLSATMTELQSRTRADPARRREILQLRSTVEADLRRSLGKSYLEVKVYGSQSNGLSDYQSDVDLALLDVEDWVDIHSVSSLLRAYGYIIQLVLPHARVPIVTFYDPRTTLTSDICIMDHHVALYRAQLVNTYRQIDGRFSNLWFSIRYLAKKYGILDSRKQRLSSYALSLMLITYLQRTTPPILPLLQNQPSTITDVEECENAFDADWRKYSTFGSSNKLLAGELLEQFFHFYGWVVHFHRHEINPRLGWVGERRKDSVAADADAHQLQVQQDAPFCIMDPFERHHNVARNITSRKNAELIRKTFQTIHLAINENPTKAIVMLSTAYTP